MGGVIVRGLLWEESPLERELMWEESYEGVSLGECFE